MKKSYRLIFLILAIATIGLFACTDSSISEPIDMTANKSYMPFDLHTLDLLTQRSESRTPEGTIAPSFVVDPSWPKPLPNNWLIGQVGGLTVDSHDNVWVYHRGRSLEQSSAYGLGIAGTDENGKPVDALGYSRSLANQIAGCCTVTPSVLKFDYEGNLLDAWGGPQDSGFLENNCRISWRTTAA